MFTKILQILFFRGQVDGSGSTTLSVEPIVRTAVADAIDDIDLAKLTKSHRYPCSTNANGIADRPQVNASTASKLLSSESITVADDAMIQHKDNRCNDMNPEYPKFTESVNSADFDNVDDVEGIITPSTTEQDEKVIKCLYYTMQCCECSIS